MVFGCFEVALRFVSTCWGLFLLLYGFRLVTSARCGGGFFAGLRPDLGGVWLF